MPSLLDGLSAANPAYLHALVERVAARTATPAVEDIIPFKRSDSRRAVVILPGSFLNVRYLSDFAAGLPALDAEVLGVNYPDTRQRARLGRSTRSIWRITPLLSTRVSGREGSLRRSVRS